MYKRQDATDKRYERQGVRREDEAQGRVRGDKFAGDPLTQVPTKFRGYPLTFRG